MKKTTLTIIIGTILLAIGTAVTVPLVPQTVHAETTTTIASGDTGTQAFKKGTSVKIKKAPPNPNSQKSIGPGEGLGVILNFILQLFAWVVGAMGVLMGTAIYNTILEAGTYVDKLGAVRAAWEMFRDLGNIILIFGFVAIGIATILDNASYGAKKALPKLIIVAIMLNFSLFATEFIIDTGNMFATQFYTQINGGSLPANGISLSNEPISHVLMNRLRLTTIYPKVGASTVSTGDASNTEQHWFITFMLGIVLFIVTAFVLGTIAIMLISRFIILVFLIIVSPVGFIGLAGIPIISGYSKKWWSALTNQTILAPILMLLLLVALKLIQSATLFSKGSIAKATQQNSTLDIASILLSFTIIIGLMLAAIIISKSLSEKATAFATRKQGGAMLGTTGFLGRHTVGRLAQGASERFRHTRLAETPLLGKSIAAGLGKAASSSYDARATRIVKGGLGAAGIDGGAAEGRGGFRKAQEEYIKKQEGYAANLKKPTLEERKRLDELTIQIRNLENTTTQNKVDQTNEENTMRGRHQEENTSAEERIKKAQEAYDKVSEEKIILTGKEGALRQENLEKLKKNLEEETEIRNQMATTQKSELNDLQQRHESENATMETEMGAAKSKKANISKAMESRAANFADNLAKGVVSRHFDSSHTARQNIRDTLSKSSEQKQVDALLEAIKSSNAPKDGGAGAPKST